VRTRLEAVVPALLRVELSQHDQQFVRRGVDPHGQCGDGFAELFDRCGWLKHSGW